MPRPPHDPAATCSRGHGVPYVWRGDRWRCPDCSIEDSRRHGQARRARRAAGIPPKGTCPSCLLIPCTCEEL